MKVDLSGVLKVALDKALAEARTLEAEGRVGEASAAFDRASGVMDEYATYAFTRADQSRRREKARTLREYAAALTAGQVKPAVKAAAPRVRPTEAPRAEDHGTGGGDEYASEIAALIHRSKVTWDQIGGLEQTKREIKFTYGLALARKPEGVKLSGWRRILLYGPPGTGKTLLAAATSNGIGATFFNVKVSNLLSKYFGESSKLISALFDAARSEADEGISVVFIDEIEALSMPRGEGADSGAERRILATLLSELDGLSDKGEDRFVLTIAATNAPWDLDDAVLSRFQKRIYIPLPDAAARRSILEIFLVQAGHEIQYSLDDVVARTDWYSGRDLERLANQAINVMIEEKNNELPDVLDRGKKIGDYQLRTRPLLAKDFETAFERIRVDGERYKELELRYRQFAANN